MIILDANMILRYLLNDNKEMADKAEQYLLDSDYVYVTIEIVAEIVYVLSGVYSMERKTIVDTIKNLLGLVNCSEMDVLTVALDTYGKYNIDFVDCVLYGYHSVKGAEIATFDKKLLKLIDNN